MVNNSSLTLSRFCEYPPIKAKCAKMSGLLVNMVLLLSSPKYVDELPYPGATQTHQNPNPKEATLCQTNYFSFVLNKVSWHFPDTWFCCLIVFFRNDSSFSYVSYFLFTFLHIAINTFYCVGVPGGKLIVTEHYSSISTNLIQTVRVSLHPLFCEVLSCKLYHFCCVIYA